MTDKGEDQAARIDELEFRLKVIERQHPEFFTKYSTLVRDQEELEHKLIEQEHRFLSVWFNFFKSFSRDHKGKRWPALRAVLQSLIPGRVMLIVTGGTLIGLFTILLMYQNNKLLASQNYWLQRQINVQAEADRQVQLVDIMEKLYEPTVGSKESLEEYDRCIKSSSEEETDNDRCGDMPKLFPKYNENTRSVALKSYIKIADDPLKKEHLESTSLVFSLAELLSEAKQLYSIEKASTSDPGQLNQSNRCNTQSTIELHNALLSKLNAKEVCLHRAKLNNVNFEGADLSRADLGGADLIDADLSDAILNKADLSHANLSFVNLKGADLSDANLSDADLSYAILNKADLSHANLSFVNLRDSDLSDANLREADLSGAYLMEANLSGADLSKVDLSKANLSNVNLSDSDLDNAILSKANIRNADLSGADLSGADLSGTDLSGTDLSGADLSEANLSGADLNEANLSGAKLWGADLRETDLREVDFKEADLWKADLSKAILSRARPSEILSLEELLLTEAHLTEADLRNAKYLTCDQLTSASGWQNARHDLSCD